jgi:CRISPR-associated protein Cas1
MPHDLHDLPRIEDGWSYLYIEHCKIDKEQKAIAIHDADGRISVPCSSLALLMLGPGTSITHDAVKTMADSGCLAIWCGEGAVRFYAQGMGETRHSRKLVKQAILVSHSSLRKKVVDRMYRMRFKEELPESLSIQQLRGLEGQRVRTAYADASAKTGVPWHGRVYNPLNWADADPVNKALSTANSCLYGICHSAIVSIGLSPGLGFIHTGHQLSFVYDIADLYKAEITIPLSFEIASNYREKIDQIVRRRCRDYFTEHKLLSRIVPDIEKALDIEIPSDIIDEDYDTGRMIPGKVWDPEAGLLPGGVNYEDE